MISEAKYKTTHGKGIKTLTATQMLTNTSNTPETLLNETFSNNILVLSSKTNY